MPALGGATEWLDSEPLGPAELRGHVVLVDFWTLTCINWLRTEPYIAPGRRPTETTGWSSSASTRPSSRPSTRSAASGRRPKSEDRLPVAVDNDYAIWSAFDTTTGRRCTSSTPTASSVTTTSAKDATSNPSAPSSGSSVERELVCVEGLGVLIGVLGFPP
jgi:hypothetical protein